MPTSKKRTTAPAGPSGLTNPNPFAPKRPQLAIRTSTNPQAQNATVGDGNEEGQNGDTEVPAQDGDQAQLIDLGPVAAGEAPQAPQASSSPPSVASRKSKKPKPHPQERVRRLWKSFAPEYLGKITKVLPDPVPTAASLGTRASKSQNAAESYQEARTQCEHAVRMIIAECIAVNQKYTDVHFDLEADLKVTRLRNCIDGLVQSDDDRDTPSDVKRVTDVFENPKFFSDGATFDDIIQGAIGDCWMMSAFSVLSCSEELVNKVCVIRDQDVGVYGFVFYRDGEWHPTIIDDKLYLASEAFDEGIDDMLATWGKEQEQKYKELFQQGSRALYFGRCRDENETWVPLLEKALAKAHGGYDALRGGQTGEAIEDLTGGVTTEIYTTNILSKEKFWKDDLCKIGKDFMFDATDAMYREWQGFNESIDWVAKQRDNRRQGVIDRHAYAVLDTYEGYGERLVKVRNPWGKTEWKGDWSDGSPKWTAEWLQRLKHTFGDDGVFWMGYRDFLNHFKHVDRTRIFDESWYTAQRWASMQVPFNNLDYQQTKFIIDVPEDTDTVIVLSQLDERYFRGFEGPYSFRLQFRISMADNEDEYIARSRPNYELRRSTNVELFLSKGKYTVLVKIEAQDWGRPTAEQVIKDNLPYRKEKIMTIGRLYDLAHQKGMPDPEEEDVTTAAIKALPTPTQTTPATTQATLAPAPIAVPVSAIEAQGPPNFPNPLPVMIVQQPQQEPDSDSEDEDEKDPWNASCVVGLRVYSKQPDLSVGVVWPPKPKVATAEDPYPETAKTPAPDRDSITKAAQDEADRDAEDKQETGVTRAGAEEGEEDKPKPKGKSKRKNKRKNKKALDSAAATSTAARPHGIGHQATRMKQDQTETSTSSEESKTESSE